MESEGTNSLPKVMPSELLSNVTHMEMDKIMKYEPNQIKLNDPKRVGTMDAS